MKKLLFIAFGLVATCLSAMTLPDNVPVVSYEKIVLNAPASLFSDAVLLVDHSIVSDFVLELQNPVQLQTLNYVHDIEVMNSKGFYKPIDYESSNKIKSLSHYDIYNGRDLLKSELYVDNTFRIENIPIEEVF
jgi:hypothetical protein